MLKKDVAFDPVLAAELIEQERLAALEALDLLDTPREEGFDRISRLITNIFGVPIALVSLMDGHRQWHKACVGLSSDSSERQHTFCRVPTANGKPLVVHDARLDPRFAANPHVTAESGIRFYAGVPLQTPDGLNIGTLCAVDTKPRDFSERELQILTDLAQVTMSEIQLRRRADFDPLTRMLSRLAFKEQAKRAISLAARHGHPLSCVVIDIDHFKAANDTHGHAAGDKVLQAVASACRSQLRATDLLGRIGGDEFAVLLPHTDLSAASDVAEKLCRTIQRSRTDLGKVVLQVTASAGAAVLDEQAADLESLLANADQALYRAKAGGRDQCVAFAGGTAARKARRRVLRGGRILFNHRNSTIDCTVRSFGEDGAGIDVWNTRDVPDRFTLVLLADNLERECRVAARESKHIEVDFC
ncbi:MAG TPA: sensor domain-containing diguanylate cyclase [Mesorhizobium sp.]|jgi:diguanylate cyclase (GGDEF)-like protein|nr:sensor domain-containing diguanylate cyclase [Mesorhizobium sp.]